MAKKRILSVGQCSSDDHRLERVVCAAVDGQMDRAETSREGYERIGAQAYDLVLVNRIIDGDGESGVDFIAAAHAAGTPAALMLVSDYAEAQAAAIAVGAVPGFGKSSLFMPEVKEVLRGAVGGAA